MSQTVHNVNAQQRAITAASRHGGRDYLDEIEQRDRAPEILTLSDVLQGEVALTFKTKNGDEVKVSLKVAALLMAAIIAFCGWAVYMVRSSARLEANVENMANNQRAYEARQDAQQREYQTQIITAMATTDAYIAHQTNRIQKMETMLSRDHQRELAEWDVQHPPPPQVKPETFRFRKPRSNSEPNNNNDGGLLLYVRSGL